MSEPILLTAPAFSTLCNLAFSLRRVVFVIEQNVPEEEELDADDLTATHIVAIMDGEVCGTLRAVVRPEHHKIGRVVVGIPWRGKGIAGRMIRKAMEDFDHAAKGRFYLTAQTDKVALYQRFGFKAFGQQFMDGGMPHIAMKTY